MSCCRSTMQTLMFAIVSLQVMNLTQAADESCVIDIPEIISISIQDCAKRCLESTNCNKTQGSGHIYSCKCKRPEVASTGKGKIFLKHFLLYSLFITKCIKLVFFFFFNG